MSMVQLPVLICPHLARRGAPLSVAPGCSLSEPLYNPAASSPQPWTPPLSPKLTKRLYERICHAVAPFLPSSPPPPSRNTPTLPSSPHPMDAARLFPKLEPPSLSAFVEL